MASALSATDLRPLLLGTMQTDTLARRTAEAAVEQLKGLPGFALALCQLALDRHELVELRQLSALVLKQFVRAHWSEEDGTSEVLATSAARIVVCGAEKAAVRSTLLLGTELDHSATSLEEIELTEMIQKISKVIVVDGDSSSRQEDGGSLSVEAFEEALKEDNAALAAEFGVEAEPQVDEHAALADEEARLGVDEAVNSVRGDGEPFNWCLIGPK